jgi:parallel beta helix pectate lyase-like protein
MSQRPQVGLPDIEHDLTARRTEIIAAADEPGLADALAQRDLELLPRVDACYSELCALPRPRRRALQRQLARARHLTAILDDWLKRSAGRALQRRLARSLAGAALLLALAAGPGNAAIITVTTNIPAISDGDGQCSLIEAIVNANDDAATHADCAAGSGADIIVLAKKTHALTTVDNSTYGPVGLPVITSDITVEGNGATISRRVRAAFGLVAVGSSGALTLKNVTLTGGKAPSMGGAITNYGVTTVQNSIISRNEVTADTSYGGGGIANFQTLTIENSTITGNKAGLGGGITHAPYDPSGLLTIRNSVISRNTARLTGGGGVFSYAGAVTIENSTISGNMAKVLPLGGGISNVYGTVTIENSTISGNKAMGDGIGGGISNYQGSLTLRNSTVSGNMATSARGGPGPIGGGIASYGNLTVENSTISANQAAGTDGAGGGIYAVDNVTLERSLISGNKAADAPEVYAATGAVVTVDAFNLFGSKDNAGVEGFTPGSSDVVPGPGVTSAKILAPLAKNGGPTKTHALKPGSPALDVVPLADPACTGTDQRGMPRPAGPGCDIGAFEKQ